MRTRRLLFTMTTAAVTALGTDARAHDPVVERLLPPGAQVGTEFLAEFHGQRLATAEDLLWYESGIALVEWMEREDKRAVAKLAVAADASLGEHFVRLRTRTGLSYVHTLWIGRFPIVDEVEPNDADAPQPVGENITIHGRIDKEDVDHYVIEARAGERISAEIEGIRLGRALFDPYLAVLDERGFEIAACDDTSTLSQDAYVSTLAPADGRYVIQVREAAFGGGEDAVYRLHIGRFPRPRVIYPTGARPGEEVDVAFLGDPAGPIQQKVTLPKSVPYPFGLYVDSDDGPPPSWNVFRVTGLGDASEVEPNDSYEQANDVGENKRAFSGVLSSPGDVDYFRFPVKADEYLRVRLMARFCGSPVDGLIWLYDSAGQQIGFNDDTGGPDGLIDVRVEKDDIYTVRVTDHLGAGGPECVYRVEVIPLRPGHSLAIPIFGRDTQARQMIPVPRGGRYATALSVNRRDFSATMRLDPRGLPEGVTLLGGETAEDLRSRVIVFEAAADAPLSSALVDLRSAPTDPSIKVLGRYAQRVDLVTGPPNNTVFYRQSLPRLAVAVTDPAPFDIELIAPPEPLVRNGVTHFRVEVSRRDGFDGPVVARMLWKPDGVGAPSTVTIAKDQTTADYRVDANGAARLGEAEFAVLGEADWQGGKALASSGLASLTVSEPFLTASIEMSAIERGTSADVFLKLEPKRAFEGQAALRLLNLPAHATAEQRDVTSDATEVAFAVHAADKTPTGKHKNLFCEVKVPWNGGWIVHYVGHGGVLRVDPKAVATATAPPKEPEKPAESAAEPERLTRLEQLRRDAAARAAAAAKTPTPNEGR